MEWSLTFPNAFSLAQLIRRSRGLLLPPFEVYRSPERLTRVELLGSGRTVAMTLTSDPAGLVLSTETRLMGMESEELSRKIWRALRLGEDLVPFMELAATHPVLRSALRQGVRFVRGTSLFEDVVKALLLTSSPPPQRGPQGGLVGGTGGPSAGEQPYAPCVSDPAAGTAEHCSVARVGT